MRLKDEQLQFLTRSSVGLVLGEEGMRALVEACDMKKRTTGGKFFQEGDPATGIFLILKGKIKLFRLSRDGRETVLHIAEAPALIAEAAIFMGKFPATAEAIEDSELLFLSRTAAFDLIEKNGRFARWFIGNMSLWLQRLVTRIEALTTSDAAARLSRYLIDLFEKTPPGLSLSSPKVTLPVKKGELARLLNMQLPSLSRIFKKMHDEGLIDVNGKTIVLKNVAALRRMTLPPLE
jgi:CRP/FNR family transcriptional regulator